MSYSDVALLSYDTDFTNRVAACYATETLAITEAVPAPYQWASDHAWDMAAQPGFGDAYASAVEASVPRPGNDPSVISDAQILGGVQSLLTPIGS
jgi:hypothetical protein